jgi:hypothetical protein
MKRRHCLGLIGALVWSAALADPSPAEQARINKLIQAVAQRKDATFIRNGNQYTCAQAAEFLQGKLKWRLNKVATVEDFIEQIGTRSTTTGEIYQVRLANGRLIPSADFLLKELAQIERR